MTNDRQITAANDNATASAPGNVQRLMAALTRLLCGEQSDPHGPAFNATLMVLVGAPLATSGLLWLADLARLNRRHAIHLSLEPGCSIPRIAFAHRQGKLVTLHEHCSLAMGTDMARACIIHSSFADGAFQLGSDMRLKHRKAPASLAAALPLLKRAYERFDALLDAVRPAGDWQPIRLPGR